MNRLRMGVYFSVVVALAATTGCSTTFGHFVPNSQFAYPNSNIKSLGPVRAEVTCFGRAFTVEEIRKCYNDALAQAPGANILINYREDTTYTSLPVSYKVKYVVEGEAAQQTIGQQHLK